MHKDIEVTVLRTPEVWGRIAMLLARNLPPGHNVHKYLDMWRHNPRLGFTTMNRHVRWTRPTDKDEYTDLVASLDETTLPPDRFLTDDECILFDVTLKKMAAEPLK